MIVVAVVVFGAVVVIVVLSLVFEVVVAVMGLLASVVSIVAVADVFCCWCGCRVSTVTAATKRVGRRDIRLS